MTSISEELMELLYLAIGREESIEAQRAYLIMGIQEELGLILEAV